MVLVAVDDLLFSSKIRAAAKAAGVDITFARTPEDIIRSVREERPALAIFDLNSAKTDPVATIARIKGEPALAGVRTVGFASHVHTDLIAAARRAGADDVLPRSVFAATLADILLGSQASRS
jgi:DNA-binding NarL/FixJ family response regulator